MLGTKIISADDHLQEAPDLWQKRLPARLRDMAPKVVADANGYVAWAWGDNPPRHFGLDVWAGRPHPEDRELDYVRWEEVYPGTYEPHERLRAMDRDGVYAVVLYPNFARAFVNMWLSNTQTGTSTVDVELATECIRAYNDHIAEFCAVDPKRLVPIGIVPLDSAESAVAEVRRMAKKGIRGGLIAPDPGNGRAWNDPVFEPVWAAMADEGMTVNLHSGLVPQVRLPARLLNDPNALPGSPETASTLQRMAMCLPVTTLLWAGIFDRYPSLKLIGVEVDAGWLAYVRHRADWVFRNARKRWHKEPNLKRPPGEYFGTQLFATFQEDVAAVQGRDIIGVDAILWASDFPHPETTFPNTRQILEEQFAGVPEKDVRKMVFANAARIYGIDGG